MKLLRKVLFMVVMAPTVCLAAEAEYRPGGSKFAKAWQEFYVDADHEPDIDDPLVAAGRKMVPAICDAVVHKDMKRRRYAIGALGYIGDRRALPILKHILGDESEKGYIRGDALIAIYQIDKEFGVKLAKQYLNAGENLSKIAEAVARRESWLTMPADESK